MAEQLSGRYAALDQPKGLLTGRSGLVLLVVELYANKSFRRRRQ